MAQSNRKKTSYETPIPHFPAFHSKKNKKKPILPDKDEPFCFSFVIFVETIKTQP